MRPVSPRETRGEENQKVAAVDWLPASEYPFEQRFIEIGLAARRPELFRADFRLAAARVSLDPPSTPLREWLALPVRQRELNLMFAPARVVRSGSSSLSGRWRTF